MTKIVFQTPTGGVSIIVPVINSGENLTPEQALERARKDIPANAVNIREFTDAQIPQDRTFRDAWRINDGHGIAVHMPKAREIHLERIRKARAPKLEELDREWMKATGQKKQKDADDIELKRQVLRDLPTTLNLEAAQTPEELKAIWPSELNE